jgi:hypothetical protein
VIFNDILNASVSSKHLLMVAATLVRISVLNHIAHQHLDLQFDFYLVGQAEKMHIFCQKCNISVMLEGAPSVVLPFRFFVWRGLRLVLSFILS